MQIQYAIEIELTILIAQTICNILDGTEHTMANLPKCFPDPL